MNFLFLLISVGVVGLDQLTKWLLYGKSFSLLGNFLWIESSFNTGAAFSMMSGAQLFFIIVASIASVVMIYLICTKCIEFSRFSRVSMALVLGGALGNLIDRIFLGGVRDFIYFKSINFAIFNIADTFVTVGCVLLVISLVISAINSYKKGDKNGTPN
ncbi:MAG: signal peptidase II [Clostridia bacterium]|nr:signal peptidase II [Clostridia bacterium]